MKRFCLITIACALSAAAAADEYNFELGFGYERSETRLVDNNFATVNPGPGFPSLSLDSESDTFEVSGTWFFDGLSDDRGPRSRAAFVDRASSLSLLLADNSSETDSVFRIPGGTPPEFRENFDTDGNSVALSGRYVFEPSGWFVTGEFGQFELDALGAEVEVDAYGVGVGRYIADTTSVEIAASRADVDVAGGGGDSDDGLAVTLRHIGDAGGWQYGATVTLSNQSIDGADGSYAVRGSLYPNRDVSLNLDVSGQLGGGAAVDSTQFVIGAGWFFTPAFEVSAAYAFADVDEPEGIDIDDDGFRLSARYRF